MRLYQSYERGFEFETLCKKKRKTASYKRYGLSLRWVSDVHVTVAAVRHQAT